MQGETFTCCKLVQHLDHPVRQIVKVAHPHVEIHIVPYSIVILHVHGNLEVHQRTFLVHHPHLHKRVVKLQVVPMFLQVCKVC